MSYEEEAAEDRDRSARLLANLEAARVKYAALGVRLRIEVDNDCWSIGPTWGQGLSEDRLDEIDDDLRKMGCGGDEGPESLAVLFAMGLGFDAGRP